MIEALSVVALQVDPYDYDKILFILKLVKELSLEETTHIVDKVWIYFVYGAGFRVAKCSHHTHECQIGL